MPQKLSTRLLITYLLLVGIVLCTIAGGLGLYLIQSPASSRQLAARLQVIADLIQKAERINLTPPKERIQQIAQRLDENYSVRIIILTSDYQVLFDSRGEEESPLPARFFTQRLLLRFLNATPQFIDENRQVWIYALRNLQNGYLLVVAAPRPSLNLRTLFRDEFILPFLQAGIIALLISVLLSVAISRWIAKPLDAMLVAVREKPIGKSGAIQVEGPTEIRQLAAAFNEMIQKVNASQKSQRDFIANVSHDLKTPLTSIQGFTQAILDDTVQTPDQVKAAAQVIQRESERMHRMVVDLLELARLDSGVVVLERKPLQVNTLLKDILERVQPRLQAKNIQPITSFSDGATILGDADRLDRAFGNLIDNAIKFTPSGGSIRITTSSEKNSVIITIQDSGPGIPHEDLERIFDRFYQVDKARQHSGTGTGLGLTIAREIIHLHGGEIQVYNSRDVPPAFQEGLLPGAMFVIRLPG